MGFVGVLRSGGGSCIPRPAEDPRYCGYGADCRTAKPLCIHAPGKWALSFQGEQKPLRSPCSRSGHWATLGPTLIAKTEISPNMASGAQNFSSPAALVTKMRLRPGVEAEFSSWHAKMCTAAAGVAGFVSAEVNAPSTQGHTEWSIVEHFRSANELKAWRASDQHRGLLEEASSLVDDSDAQALREDEVAEGFVDSAVTEVVTTYVKPGKDREYQEWAKRIHRAEAQFPGYRGGLLQPPASDHQRYWVTLVRFATPEQLDA
jgi:antibiotic biosynthesis monooxygenase (ABM) superfamily enzyme